MTERSVTMICTAADRAAAQAKASDLGDGPESFSVPLSPEKDVTTPALATHWAQSGAFPDYYVEAFDVSLAPMVKVFPLLAGQDFDAHLAACTPPLNRIYEVL
jgi:hypothetical protein